MEAPFALKTNGETGLCAGGRGQMLQTVTSHCLLFLGGTLEAH